MLSGYAAHPGRAGDDGAGEAMKNRTSHNGVKFLLDGEEFFKELAVQLDKVIAAPPSRDTYVRLAFWEADEWCMIDRAGQRTVGAMLRAAADAGHTVQFIYWKPGGLAGEILKTAWELPPAMPAYQSKTRHTVGPNNDEVKGSIQVYQEVHRGWFFGTTNHQKMAIFSIGGKLTAIVGGINLTEKSYARVSHEPDAAPESPDYPELITLFRTLGVAKADEAEARWRTKNWHDTAVALTGPAAAAVEEEWLRRWGKRRPSPRVAPVKAPTQAPVEGGHDVTILTTNSELRTRETHIREAMCERIRAAKRYVYLENYVLSDPLLVAALADRLRATKDLVVFFVAGKDNAPYSFLNRMTWLRLVIAAGGEGTLSLEGRDKVEKIEKNLLDRVVSGGDFSDPLLVDQVKLFFNPWFSYDELRYRTPQGEQRRVRLGKICGAQSNRVLFAYPSHGALEADDDSLYVHSKLVLVDDETAFIGSANLSYRSMVYDGEICARIDGSAAKDIRVALFKHFDLDCPDASAIQAAILSRKLLRSASDRSWDPNKVAFLLPYQDADFDFDFPDRMWCNHTWH